MEKAGGAKPYKPKIIGVEHIQPNLAETKRLIDEAYAKGARSIGLEISPKIVQAIRSGNTRPGFFLDIARHAQNKKMTIHGLVGDKYFDTIAKRMLDPKKGDLWQEYGAALTPQIDRHMAKEAEEKTPDIIIAGGHHAQALAKTFGVEKQQIGHGLETEFEQLRQNSLHAIKQRIEVLKFLKKMKSQHL